MNSPTHEKPSCAAKPVQSRSETKDEARRTEGIMEFLT